MKAREYNGKITTYGILPSFWEGIHNFQLADTVVHEAHGFFDVIQPTVTETQRKGDIYFNTDHFTYYVTDLTQAELDAKAEALIDSEIQNEIQDGIDASNRLKKYLKTNLNITQYKSARVIVLPVWIALRHGDFDIALDEMNAITVSSEPYITMKQVIINEIQEYLDAQA